MRLYFIILLAYLPLQGMVEHLEIQNQNKCLLVKLPMGTMAHILSYVIAPFCPHGFYVGKTKKARNFLTTCKYYYASKELTHRITKQLAYEYGLPRVFVFAPLYLSTITAHDCFKEWLQTSGEVDVYNHIKFAPSKEKIEFLDDLLKEASNENINPNGTAYTPSQRQYIITKILAIKTLAQQIA